MLRKLSLFIALTLLAIGCTKPMASSGGRPTQGIEVGPHLKVLADDKVTGTAFVYAAYGPTQQQQIYIITAAHVIETSEVDAGRVSIESGGRLFKVHKAIIPNPTKDFALLYIDEAADYRFLTRENATIPNSYIFIWNYSLYPPILDGKLLLSTGYMLDSAGKDDLGYKFAAVNFYNKGGSGAAVLSQAGQGVLGLVVGNIIGAQNEYQGIVRILSIEDIDDTLATGTTR